MTAATGPSGERPVVVVGAGPVGQTTALLLARWGVPAVLLDRAPARRRVGSRAICQQRDVLDIWEAAGCGERIASEGVTWTTARTFFREHELKVVRFADQGRSPFPPWVNISQSRTEEHLDAAMARSHLVDVRWGWDVEAIEPTADGARVRCRTPQGGRVVDAPAVVVAAGARCDALRDQLGVRFDGEDFDDAFLICDIRAELARPAAHDRGALESERRFWFDPAWNPGRQVLIHPCPDGVYRIDWQVPEDFDLEAEEAGGGLDRRIRQIVGDQPYEVVWRSVYRFSARCAEPFAVGRVLLAGDAAHQMAPFGARGLNSGVQDAENAAWKLAFVLRGWAPETLVGTYDAERRAAARENLDVTSATMRFLVPQTADERRHRVAVLEAAVADVHARARVDSGRLAEPFWYADSPLTTPDPTRPPPTRPPPGAAPAPAPGVLLPDLPTSSDGTPLRRMVRDGLLALVADAHPGAVEEAAAALRAATRAPTAAVDAVALGVADGLGMRAGEVWIVRPDGHLAAAVAGSDPTAITAAARRALGHDG